MKKAEKEIAQAQHAASVQKPRGRPQERTSTFPDQELVISSTRDPYRGYNLEMIDKYIDMGFAVEGVVSAFERWGIANYEGSTSRSTSRIKRPWFTRCLARLTFKDRL
jgi:hypothetical protein